MPISKLNQGIEFIPYCALVSILNVIRALLPLAPFLQAIGGDADELSSAVFGEHRTIVRCPQVPALEFEEGWRDFVTLSRADRSRWRVCEGWGSSSAVKALCR